MGEYNITLLSEETYNGYIERKLEVKNNNVRYDHMNDRHTSIINLLNIDWCQATSETVSDNKLGFNWKDD